MMLESDLKIVDVDSLSTDISETQEEKDTCYSNSKRLVDEYSVVEKKLIRIIMLYEDYVQSHLTSDQVKQMRTFNRKVFSRVSEAKDTYSNIPRCMIAMSIVLLHAERVHLKKEQFLQFIHETLQEKKVKKISDIRQTKAYALTHQITKLLSTTTVC